jgi:predicted phosphodiesterase
MTLLIISDVHGNWPALDAVLAAEPEHDAVAFCGDVVDYPRLSPCGDAMAASCHVWSGQKPNCSANNRYVGSSADSLY